MSTSKYREIFKGFKAATPDGSRNKLNSVDPIDHTGSYILEIMSTGTFSSDESNGEAFKCAVLVRESDNPKVKVGQEMALIYHGLTDNKDYIREIALGNIKALLAAAMTYLFSEPDVEIEPNDESQEWEDMIVQACEDEETLKGALIGCKIQYTPPSKKSRSGKPFGKSTFFPVDTRAAA